jgi:SAM-dependent methyltransferase
MFDAWLKALEDRHLADLRVQEVTRALRALSSRYVVRRSGDVQHSLDTKGKRAAFALYYAPLHFLVTDLIVRAVGAHVPPPRSVLDIGCGTGAAGAAWALAAGATAQVTGIDRHPWAVGEARWTYATLGLDGRARQGDAMRIPAQRDGSAILAAYVLNEMTEEARTALEAALARAAGERRARVLIIEPISRSVSPWWDAMASRLSKIGGRADEWRFPIDLPPLLRMLDRATGLDHRELTARSIYIPEGPEA